MNELDRLFTAWLAGPLDPADAERLCALLGDPEQRERWRALADLEGALAESGAATAAAPATASPNPTRRVRHVRSSRRSGRRPWWPVAVAATLVLAVGGWLSTRNQTPQHLDTPPAPVASDLPSHDGRLLARGDGVYGPAVLMWADGSEARVLPGAHVQVPQTGTGLALATGELAVQVVPQAGSTPFTVQTPHARAEVIGTRFHLRARDQATSLMVDEGRVRFIQPGRASRELSTGGYIRSDHASLSHDGLVAWWPLDEGTGDIAYDASGNGHTGRIVGPQWTPDGLRFPGGDARIDIEPTGALASVHEGSYSIVAWFQPAALPQERSAEDPEGKRDGLAVIVGRTGWTSGLYLRGDGRWLMQHFLSDRSPQPSHGAGPPEVGQWYHLVGVVDRAAGETRLFVNGVMGERERWMPGAAAFVYRPTDLWHIGISNPGATSSRWPAQGLIRAVRVYARAVDVREIATLAAADAPRP